MNKIAVVKQGQLFQRSLSENQSAASACVGLFYFDDFSPREGLQYLMSYDSPFSFFTSPVSDTEVPEYQQSSISSLMRERLWPNSNATLFFFIPVPGQESGYVAFSVSRNPISLSDRQDTWLKITNGSVAIDTERNERVITSGIVIHQVLTSIQEWESLSGDTITLINNSTSLDSEIYHQKCLLVETLNDGHDFNYFANKIKKESSAPFPVLIHNDANYHRYLVEIHKLSLLTKGVQMNQEAAKAKRDIVQKLYDETL